MTDDRDAAVCATKRRHPTEDQALAELRRARIHHRGKSKVEGRVYRCPSCDGWHLTARELTSVHDTKPLPPADVDAAKNQLRVVWGLT